MAIQPPNNGLITENAQQYYQGAQNFRGDAGNTAGQSFVTSFDTDLYLGDWNPLGVNYGLNNFKIYTRMEIQGYPNYLVYEDGRVYNQKYNRFLKQNVNSHGYYIVPLCKDGKPKNHLIHRLIGLHYIPNPENKPYIDHIDRNRQNNELSNLRWVSYIENNNNFTPRNGSIYGTILKGCINPTYIFTQYIQGKRHTKRFKTLEDAQAYQKEYNEKIKINNNI